MLRVGGLTPLSTSDWPGKLVAVVFCQGCPWRCGYCHNSDLIPARGDSEIPWEDVLAFLRRRQGLLDGVVFSGGEPTLQGRRCRMRCAKCARSASRSACSTGGMYPKKLDAVLPLVDWVGLDVKAPFADYARITGADGSGAGALAGLQQILASGVDHEVRTTVHPALLSDAEVAAMAHDLAARGVKHYVMAKAFRGQGYQKRSTCAVARCARALCRRWARSSLGCSRILRCVPRSGGDRHAGTAATAVSSPRSRRPTRLEFAHQRRSGSCPCTAGSASPRRGGKIISSRRQRPLDLDSESRRLGFRERKFEMAVGVVDLLLSGGQ